MTVARAALDRTVTRLTVSRSLRTWLLAVVAAGAMALLISVPTDGPGPAASSTASAHPVALLHSPVTPDGVTGDHAAPMLTFVCSGSALDNGLVVTAAHCLEGGPLHAAHGSTDICRTSGWRSTALVTVSTDHHADVAVLRATVPIPVDDSLRSSNLPAMAMGWQQLDRSAPLQCELQTAPLGGCDAGAELVECVVMGDGRICSGMSGAPVVDGDGAVVGVVSSSLWCRGGPTWIGRL